MNLGAGAGLAITEFPGAHGPADYLLYVDGKAIGVVEAKPLATPTRASDRPTSRRYAIRRLRAPCDARYGALLYQGSNVAALTAHLPLAGPTVVGPSRIGEDQDRSADAFQAYDSDNYFRRTAWRHSRRSRSSRSWPRK
jgi:hypothetical protein